jgi:hypothetical protein
MTREEEIKLTADKYCLDEYTRLGFVAGAEWADEHPKLVTIPLEEIENVAKDVIDKDWQARQDRLWNMIERNLRAQFIRKACDWLLEWETHQGEDIEIVELFKEAMKGE